MKEQLLNLVHSEVFWLTIGAIVAYFANSIVSRGIVAKLPPTSPAFRLLRAAHGFLNKIDPDGNEPPPPIALASIGLAFVLASSVATQGCAVLRSPTFWDGIEKACVVAMTARPEVQAEAKRRNITFGALAEALCKVPDIFEPFFVDPDAASKADNWTPANEAVSRAQAKGLIR